MRGAKRPIYWVGGARQDLRGFPSDARKQAGVELMAVQQRLEPSDWRPMKSIGKGVREIRIHEGNEYRIIYVVKRAESLYVLHCFVKKSRNTAKRDIELARDRLKQVNKHLHGK